MMLDTEKELKEKLLDLAELNNTYKSKWINEFSNVSNSRLEDMWSDIFDDLQDVQTRNYIRRNGLDDDGKSKKGMNIVYSSTMGTGKSTTVQHYLEYGLDTKFFKALVVVALTETCDEYEEKLKDRGAVAVHSKNDKALEDNLDAPILIITHKRLTDLLNKGLADSVFNQYDLVVIDERINTYQHIGISFKQLHNLKSILDSNYLMNDELTYVINHMSETMTKYRDAETNKIFVVNKYTEDRDTIINWDSLKDYLYSVVADTSNSLDNTERKILKTFANEFRAISKQGRMKIAYYQKMGNTKAVSFNVVVDFLPLQVSKVVFDGTASINDTYKLLNEHIGNDTVQVKEYHKLRSFKNANINFYTMSTGKSSLVADEDKMTKKEYEKKLVQVKANVQTLVSNTITRYGKEEKVLLVVHKLNVPHIEPLIEDTNYAITYWGKHVGSNEWKEYNKVVVWGLNYLPENVYTAMYFSTLSSKVNTEVSGIDDFKAGFLTEDILQAIFRGAMRSVVDDKGNCSTECEVVVSLPNNPTKSLILDRMKCIVWDGKYNEVTDGAKPVNLRSSNTKKMKELLAKLKVEGESPYREEYNKKLYMGNNPQLCILPEDIGYTRNNVRDLLLRGTNSDANNKLLLDNNWLYTTPTEEDREACALDGRVKYIFKYIGKFSNEAPILDINGEEF